jgi:hypothetical protein
MKMNRLNFSIVVLLLFAFTEFGYSQNSEIYSLPKDVKSRWASFENIDAIKGEGGKVGKGAKGYPYHVIQPGESVTLLDVKGTGVINRIWMTFDDLYHLESERRSMKIEMFWDGSDKPAVSAPVEDFFNVVFGRMVAFENELFSSPEGRSFMSYVQMPYRKSARIVVTNESKEKSHRIFYDVNFTKVKKLDKDAMYFHAYWRRDKATKLGEDFMIAPKVESAGRFLGCNIGIINFHKYTGWWGEGEVKVYMDGDDKNPTLIGSGTEDYIGSGWEQGVFHTKYMGSSVVDNKNGEYAFYRFHIIDPIYFYKDIKVTIQQMGGTQKGNIKKFIKEGKPALPVCYIDGDKVQLNFFDGDASFDDENYKDGTWTNYYRQDDVCATSYFYLTTPNGVLDKVVDFEKRK